MTAGIYLVGNLLAPSGIGSAPSAGTEPSISGIGSAASAGTGPSISAR